MARQPSYVVLVGDLVASKAAPDRAGVQARLERVLEHAARTLRNRDEHALVVPPMITVGDEFQALLKHAGAAVDLMRIIREHMWPMSVSFGVGRGGIATPVHRDHIGRMDGPAFHAARDAVQQAKARHGTVFRGFGPIADTVLFGLYQGFHAVARRWTDRQVEIMARARQGGTQSEVAHDLGVSQSVVSEALKAAAFDAIHDVEVAARTLLDAAHTERIRDHREAT